MTIRIVNRHLLPRYMTLTQKLDHYSMPEPNSGCILWLGYAIANGYGRTIWKGRLELAHRLAWEDARGPIPVGLNVLHKCDVRACINPAHLFLGTNQDNVDDKMAKNRHRALAGENHYKAKLTVQDVLEIRSSRAPQKLLAARHGIHEGTVSKIKRGVIWKSV